MTPYIVAGCVVIAGFVTAIVMIALGLRKEVRKFEAGLIAQRMLKPFGGCSCERWGWDKDCPVHSDYRWKVACPYCKEAGEPLEVAFKCTSDHK